MRSPKQLEHLRRIAHRGGKARAQQFTPASQRAAQSHRTPESLSASGKIGYRACVAKHGYSVANRHAAAYRRTHRSEPERWTEKILTDAGYSDFVREFEFDGDARTVDLAFEYRRVVIEVNGKQHYEPSFGETESRAARDVAKVAWLTDNGWTVYTVNATADRTVEAARLLEFASQHLTQFVAPDELPF